MVTAGFANGGYGSGGITELQHLEQHIVVLKRITKGLDKALHSSETIPGIIQAIQKQVQQDGFVLHPEMASQNDNSTNNTVTTTAHVNNTNNTNNQYHQGSSGSTTTTGRAAGGDPCCVIV